MAEATAVANVKRSGWSALPKAAGMLLVASAIAAICAGTIFAFVSRADFLTGAAATVNRVMFEHSLLAIGAAASPIFAALLVGYGYMMRGLRRRRAEKNAPAAARAEPPREP